ncbi:MAG: DedA family protein [Sphingomonadales bacterium]
MCLEKREKAFYYAGLCTIASVLGGILGYAIGYFFWATIGDPLVNFYGFQSEFGLFEEKFVAYGFWIVFVFGITFFPYKVITIASGFVALNPVAFILASVASRGLRFFIEAGLLWKFGEKIQDFIEKKLALAVSLAVLIIVALVVGYKIFSG